MKIAQGFTTSIYNKPASHDFTALTRPLPTKQKPIVLEKDGKVATFIANLPQKYIWIAMVALFAICFAWAFFTFGNFWSAENISVPNVVGKPVEVAETSLKN